MTQAERLAKSIDRSINQAIKLWRARGEAPEVIKEKVMAILQAQIEEWASAKKWRDPELDKSKKAKVVATLRALLKKWASKDFKDFQ